ncbi:mucin-1-like [Clytia hemisphaerica]|uniref:mucin-1-like n=1 Tax=Clytia hemisphaerica TaxID=252671 RepID=UPI0034D4F75F
MVVQVFYDFLKETLKRKMRISDSEDKDLDIDVDFLRGYKIEVVIFSLIIFFPFLLVDAATSASSPALTPASSTAPTTDVDAISAASQALTPASSTAPTTDVDAISAASPAPTPASSPAPTTDVDAISAASPALTPASSPVPTTDVDAISSALPAPTPALTTEGASHTRANKSRKRKKLAQTRSNSLKLAQRKVPRLCIKECKETEQIQMIECSGLQVR